MTGRGDAEPSERPARLGSFLSLVRRRLRGPGAQVLLEQSRRREAEAIAEVAKSLTRGLDLGAVAQRIADHTRDLLDARSACVYRLDPTSGDLVAIAIAGQMG